MGKTKNKPTEAKEEKERRSASDPGSDRCNCGTFALQHIICFIFIQSTKKGTDEYNHIEQMAVTDRAPEDEELVDAVSEPKPPISVDFDTLKSVNPDVVGWIYIEAFG